MLSLEKSHLEVRHARRFGQAPFLLQGGDGWVRGGCYSRRSGGGIGEEEPVGAAADEGRIARTLDAAVGGEDRALGEELPQSLPSETALPSSPSACMVHHTMTPTMMWASNTRPIRRGLAPCLTRQRPVPMGPRKQFSSY